MTWSDLFAEFAKRTDLLVQTVNESLLNCTTKKKGPTRITFATDRDITPANFMGNPKWIGVVVWIHRIVIAEIERLTRTTTSTDTPHFVTTHAGNMT
jgi:hypothetical protein